MITEVQCPHCLRATLIEPFGIPTKFTCAHCGEHFVYPATQMGFVKKRGETIGVGCVVQLAGLVLLFLFPIGTVFGVVLLVYGGRLAYKFYCSVCGNRVENQGVRLCPHCKSMLV